MKAVLDAKSREMDDLIGGYPTHAGLLQGLVIHAGQHADSQHEHLSGLGHRRADHFSSPAEMNGRHIHPELAGGSDRMFGGIRDVMKLQIEEDAETMVLCFGHDGRSLRSEQLQPDFHPGGRSLQFTEKLEGGIGGGNIDGDDDFFFS